MHKHFYTNTYTYIHIQTYIQTYIKTFIHAYVRTYIQGHRITIHGVLVPVLNEPVGNIGADFDPKMNMCAHVHVSKST